MANELARLNDTDARLLTELETRIRKVTSSAFRESGAALALIRDRKLYRASHTSFDAYCQGTWELTEPQAWALAGLPDGLQPVALERALGLAGNGPFRTGHVEQAVKTLREEQERASEPAPPPLADDPMFGKTRSDRPHETPKSANDRKAEEAARAAAERLAASTAPEPEPEQEPEAEPDTYRDPLDLTDAVDEEAETAVSPDRHGSAAAHSAAVTDAVMCPTCRDDHSQAKGISPSLNAMIQAAKMGEGECPVCHQHGGLLVSEIERLREEALRSELTDAEAHIESLEAKPAEEFDASALYLDLRKQLEASQRQNERLEADKKALQAALEVQLASAAAVAKSREAKFTGQPTFGGRTDDMDGPTEEMAAGAPEEEFVGAPVASGNACPFPGCEKRLPCLIHAKMMGGRKAAGGRRR